MNFSKAIRRDIKKATLDYIEQRGIPKSRYVEKNSAILFKDEAKENPNFLNTTFQAIRAHDKWNTRLLKLHSHFNDGTKELSSSNSSDALLMNIFCHPDFRSWMGPQKLLEVEEKEPVFGWNPQIEHHSSPTEIDMRIGKTIFEAKLTEKDFTSKNKQTVLKVYPGIEKLFNLQALERDNEITHYQLLRNIYAAHKHNLSFKLLLDARRPDLMKHFLEVVKSIKDYQLRKRVDFITWQELASTVGGDLKTFLKIKYAIA